MRELHAPTSPASAPPPPARRALPIRWRLTLWYVGVLFLLLALLGSALYIGLRVVLYRALDDQLRNQASSTTSALHAQYAAIDGDALDDTLRRLTLPTVEDDYALRLRTPDGTIIVSTGEDHEDLPDNLDGLRHALTGTTDVRWIDADGNRMRLLTIALHPPDDGADSGNPDADEEDDDDDNDRHDQATAASGITQSDAASLDRSDEIIGVLEVATESEVDETLGNMLRLLVLLTPVLLVAATGGGVWLAGRALRPIDHLTRLASSLDEHDLTTRLDLDLPDDELGRLTATLNAMLDRIEQAFQRQQQFTADAAHELRTPLALLQSQIELALSQPRLPERDSTAFAALLSDVERLTRLVSALLLLTQDDRRGLELEREPVDLALLLELVAEQYSVIAEETHVRLHLDTARATLEADEDRLLQVIINLLDNALHHAPPGSTVTLHCREEADTVIFSVSDEGPGIAPEQQAAVFERFVRLDSGRARHIGGIGLGLSLVRSIVAAHGGTVWVDSTPGAGATFSVRLPRGV